MNRDHKVFTVVIKYDKPVQTVDAFGDTQQAGTERATQTVVVIATDIVLVKAWLIENPFRYRNVELIGFAVEKITAVIETHTF